MPRHLRAFCVLCLWTLCSCAPGQDSSAPPPDLVLVTVGPNATATPTPFQPMPAADTALASPIPAPTDIPAPTETNTVTPIPAPETVIPGPTLALPPPAPASSRTQYTFYVALDYAGRAAAVNEAIRYLNTTGQTLSNIVLAVEPNLWSNCFSLTALTEDGVTVTDYTLDGQRLTLFPPQPLQPGAVTTLTLAYTLALPVKRYEATFGYLGYQLNLTDWYPFIVPYAGDWVLHDPRTFGEHLVYDAADFDVNIKVNDPAVILAASASGESNGDSTHYRLEAARTFVLSASDKFKVSESAVGTVPIRSYYFAGDENAAQAVVWMATQSLGLYGVKFAPYPYPSLSIVETEVPDGQEFDGLVFLAEKFYSDYNGTSKSNLVAIGTHEISHQWWFGLVGNDQALEPWLDEALAVYSEKIFYEYNYPRYGDWWWNFRVNYFGPAGWVDTSIYDAGTFRLYTNAVYLNGANFLDDLRTRIGDDAFFAFLQDYASRFAHHRASAYDFFALVRQHTSEDFSDIVQTYFQGSH